MGKNAVSFRVSPAVHRHLKEAVKRSSSPSLAAYLEAMVIEHLGAGSTQSVSDDLDQVKAEVSRLRTDLAAGLEALLIAGGEPLKPEDAKACVDDLLRRKPRSRGGGD